MAEITDDLDKILRNFPMVGRALAKTPDSHSAAQSEVTTRLGADEALLLRIASHRDRAAFAKIYLGYERSAFNLAMHLAGSRALAEEAVQEAFLDIWTSASTFRPGIARAWVLRIVANQSLKKFRTKLKRGMEMRLDPEAVAGRSEIPTVGLERQETLAALRLSLATLPEVHRKVVALYFEAGFAQSEIAVALAMPARTVSFKLEEALKFLRMSLTRAGVAGAMPVLAANRLGEALSSLHAPTPGIYEQISSRLAPGVFNAAGHTTRCAFVTKAYGTPLCAVVVMAVASAAGLWWAANSSPIAPAAIGIPSAQDMSTACPQEDIAPASTVLDIDRIWNFKDGPRADLKVVQHPWDWKRLSPKVAGMVSTKEEPEGVLLPMRFPKRPVRIEVIGRFLDRNKTGNLGVYWAPEGGVADYPNYFKSKVWFKDVSINSGRLVQVIYLFDEFLVKEIAGQLYAVRRYEQPYPGDRLLISFSNQLVEELRVKTIRPDGIPEKYRNPMDLCEGHYLTQADDAFFELIAIGSKLERNRPDTRPKSNRRESHRR